MIEFVTYFFNFPPLFPLKQKVFNFFLLATFTASIKFSLFPEVVMATQISPWLPIASTCLENIYLKPKSLPIAVRADVSVVNAIEGNAFRFFLNLTVSSVARCCASAALPPLPKKIIFFFFLMALMLCSQSLKKFLSN